MGTVEVLGRGTVGASQLRPRGSGGGVGGGAEPGRALEVGFKSSCRPVHRLPPKQDSQ